MMNKVNVLAAGGLTLAAVLIFKSYRRNKHMSMKIPCDDIIRELSDADEKMQKPTLTDAAKKNLIERIEGMSAEELEIVADTIPIDLCLGRIQKELDKARNFESLVKNAIGSLN